MKQFSAEIAIINELVRHIFSSKPLRVERVAEGGTNRWYDLGHFHMRDGEYISYSRRAMLIRGYSEIVSLPANYEWAIRFVSVLINVRALARSLQKRPPDRFTQRQVKVLREDMAALSIGIP